MMASEKTLDTIAIKPLSEVLSYQNENVVFRFMEEFSLDLEESMKLFTETKKWLWLLAVRKEMKNKGIEVPLIFINEALLIIDEMWHTFILFTVDYRNFCMDYFGVFIDHEPTTKAEKDAYYEELAENPEKVKQEMQEKVKLQYSYIYDNLGEEVLLKWYNDFPIRYSIENIQKLRKYQ